MEGSDKGKAVKKNLFHTIVGILFVFSSVFLFISIIGAFFRPTFFPFLSFIALFFAPLWIMNVAFLLYFIITKNRLAILSLILMLVSTFEASLLFSFSIPDNSENSAKLTKLVSFNTGNPKFGSQFNSRKASFDNPMIQDADIICLQEFLPENEIGIETLERFINKVNVDFRGSVCGQSSGLSIYTDYEIVDFGYLKQKQEDTYALWCHIVTNTDTITVINVQLQSIRLAKNELEAMTNYKRMVKLPSYFSSIYNKLKRGFLWREEQVERLREMIASNKYPLVLCGDFNDPPSSFTYREIAKLLDDAFLKRGNGFGFTYAGGIPLLRIDFIMTDESIEVYDFQKTIQSHSDHYPLVINFASKQKHEE